MNVEINTFYVEINMLNMEPLKYRRERRNHCEGLQSNAESEDWERAQNIYPMSFPQNFKESCQNIISLSKTSPQLYLQE